MQSLGKVIANRFRLSILITLYLSILAGSEVQAGTIVRFSTSVGDFSMELLDDVAPVTVQNFLNYVVRGDYNQTLVHRVEDNFVAQMGGYRFEPFVGPIDVPSDPPIPNEFNVSNTRGTVAMAKIDGNPNSATNQWFINLRDNSDNLDDNNGGFTVFGTVLGDGMNIVDIMDILPFVDLGTSARGLQERCDAHCDQGHTDQRRRIETRASSFKRNDDWICQGHQGDTHMLKSKDADHTQWRAVVQAIY